MTSQTHTVRGSRSTTSQRGGGRGKKNPRNDYFHRENTDENNIDSKNSFDNDSRKRGNARGSRNPNNRGSRSRGNRVDRSVENTGKDKFPSPSLNTKKPDHSQNPIFRNQLMARFSQFLPPSSIVESETVQNPPFDQPSIEPSENLFRHLNSSLPNNSFGSNLYPEGYGSNQPTQAWPNTPPYLRTNQNSDRFNTKEWPSPDRNKEVSTNSPENHRQRSFVEMTSNLRNCQNGNSESEGSQPFQTRQEKTTFKDINENDKTSETVNNFFQNFKNPPKTSTQDNLEDSSLVTLNQGKPQPNHNTKRKPEKPGHVSTGDKKVDRIAILQQYGFLIGKKSTSEPEPTKSMTTPPIDEKTNDNVTDSLCKQLNAYESEIKRLNAEKNTKTPMKTNSKGTFKYPVDSKEHSSNRPNLAGILKGVVDFNTDLINEQKSSAQRNLAARNLKRGNSPPPLYRNTDSFESDIAGNPLTIVKKINDTNDIIQSRNERIEKLTAAYEVKQVEHLAKEKEKADKKRQEYLARYEHVDQGHRLYQPYLEEAAGFDPGFFITEDEARYLQQEKMEREAEIYKQKEKEREEKERQREEEKRKQKQQKYRNIDAGYKLGHGTKDTPGSFVNEQEARSLQESRMMRESELYKQQQKENEERQLTEIRTQMFMKATGYPSDNRPKVSGRNSSVVMGKPHKRDIPEVPPKPNRQTEETDINPEDFVLEGQTYEEALELQQQLLLQASKMKSQQKENKEQYEKQGKFDVQRNYYEENTAFPNPPQQGFVGREIQNTPVKSETFPEQLIKRSEQVHLPAGDFVLEGQTYEEAVEMQQQMLLAASKIKDMSIPTDLRSHADRREIPKTPLKSETCSKQSTRFEKIKQPDDKIGLKRGAAQTNENKSPNKMQKEQPTSPNTPSDKSRNSLVDKFFSNVDAWERNVSKAPQSNKVPASAEQKQSDLNFGQQSKNSFKPPVNKSAKQSEKSNFKQDVTNLKPDDHSNTTLPKPLTVQDLEKTMFRQKPTENKTFQQPETYKGFEKQMFQHKPSDMKNQPDNVSSKTSQNSNLSTPENTVFKQFQNLSVRELENMIFKQKPQENGNFKQQPSSLVVKSSPRGPPTLLIRNSENALQQAKQRLINDIDKYGVLVTSKSVEEPVAPKAAQYTPRSALEELGKATGAIPKYKTPIDVPPKTDKNPTLNTNNPAKPEAETEPVIDFKAEMRAVRQRMQEEYEKSLKQLKENNTDPQ